ncbi:MAG TPA: DUF2341 domain-containing protein, partial [Rhizomicrobium sp.]|nr:DUF2341 domain-containing protein [Rhizomicrobium sp.]
MQFNWKPFAAVLFGVVFSTLATLPASAEEGTGWWQKDWPYRKQITIDTTPRGANISQPVGRTALLIRLHSGNFAFADAQESGNDLRFVASDNKTPLAFHIESFDASLGVATVWVDIPDFPAGAAKDIWLYYGNKNAPAAANSAATFDADYALVYHFDGAAGMAPRDKTANGNNAVAAPSGLDAGGVIAKAAKFAGTAPIPVAASSSLDLAAGGQFTFSSWVNYAGPQARAILFSRHEGATSMLIGLDQGMPFVEATGVTRIAAPQAMARGQWAHLAVTADGTKITIYVNGQAVISRDGAFPAMKGGIAFAGDTDASSGNASFAGELDEVRVSRTARSASAIYADVVGEGPQSKLVRFGEDEKQSGNSFGYFGIIIQNVTIDAWVVIGILGIMALASWIVMWAKVSYANMLDRANDRFLDIYRKAGGKPEAVTDAAIRGGRRVSQSSIYRIYRAGADEIARRAEQARGRPVLHAEAIEVIRALMDATMIR